MKIFAVQNRMNFFALYVYSVLLMAFFLLNTILDQYYHLQQHFCFCLKVGTKIGIKQSKKTFVRLKCYDIGT